MSRNRGMVGFKSFAEISDKLERLKGVYPENSDDNIMLLAKTILELRKADGIRRNPTESYDSIRGSFDNLLASVMAGIFMVGRTFEGMYAVDFSITNKGLKETEMFDGIEFEIGEGSRGNPVDWALYLLSYLGDARRIDQSYASEIWVVEYVMDLLVYANVTGSDIYAHLDKFIENTPTDVTYDPVALPF